MYRCVEGKRFHRVFQLRCVAVGLVVTANFQPFVFVVSAVEIIPIGIVNGVFGHNLKKILQLRGDGGKPVHVELTDNVIIRFPSVLFHGAFEGETFDYAVIVVSQLPYAHLTPLRCVPKIRKENRAVRFAYVVIIVFFV